MRVAAVVFDAYGTLFDVHSVARRAEALFPGHGAAIAKLWRERQIDYSRLRTLSGRYVPFWQVTADALAYTLSALNLEPGALAQELLQCYQHLDVYPEIRTVLETLSGRGLALSILSNGDATMLATALGHAALDGHFAHVLSADTVRRYKTAPEVYALAETAFGVKASEMVFVSSNCWDACGAAWYGFQTFWVNRSHAPLEKLDINPRASAENMLPLVEFVDALIAS